MVRCDGIVQLALLMRCSCLPDLSNCIGGSPCWNTVVEVDLCYGVFAECR